MSNNKLSYYHIFLIFVFVVGNIYSFPMKITIAIDAVLLIVSGVLFSSIKMDTKINSIITTIALLAIYTLFVCILNNSFSNYTLGKPIRLIAICLVFLLLSDAFSDYKQREIEYGLILGLSLHLLCVYIQFIKPQTKSFFFSFLDSEKEQITDFALRAFGLCSSFDAAGLCLCVLIVLFWMIFKRDKKKIYLLLSFITVLGCFMVSRTSMLVSTVLFCMMLFSLMKTNKKVFLLTVILFLFGVYYVWDYADLLLQENAFEDSYRPESAVYLTGDMLFLPGSIADSLLGTAENATNSDIGYVKIINMIGIVGLVFVLLLYFRMIRLIKPSKQYMPEMYHFMVLFLVLLLLFNYKLLLLYSRGINDLFFFLIFILLRQQTKYTYENSKTSNI